MGRTPPGQTRERIFRFVRDRLLSARPPTVRDVQAAFGFRAVQTAREHLEALVAEGRLGKEPGRSRGYLEGYITIQSNHDPDEMFGLRVRGESMSGVGILPGDIVVVRKQPTAKTGDIVVALVGDEATVKRFRTRRGRVELQPANPAFETIIPDPKELTLLGKVVEVRRFLERS